MALCQKGYPKEAITCAKTVLNVDVVGSSQMKFKGRLFPSTVKKCKPILFFKIEPTQFPTKLHFPLLLLL